MLARPGMVAAHPLGNFTINHYAGLRVDARRILLDVVIDEAEIPAFQERQGSTPTATASCPTTKPMRRSGRPAIGSCSSSGCP